MPDWKFQFWDMEAALKLIRDQYSWFLPTFEGYSTVVAKGDALRPLVLHAYGGMYVDLDVECYRPVDTFLEGHDLVLQAEEHNSSEALINAVMASTPRHPLWLDVISLMMERSASSHNVLFATGPQVISEAYKSFMKTHDLKTRESGLPKRQRLTPHVYQLGEFYLPCNWLSQELCAEVDKTEPKPGNLAGFHHWAGSWKVSL
ncbi:g6651 [Coccomyxa viridis]|uniref:G6651 protein n=1 Tax=Coccomyxa viridis TaxID=1274662 RepID=A0ABP1FYC8_9CHLO